MPGGQSLQRKLRLWLCSSSCTEAGLGLAHTPDPRARFRHARNTAGQQPCHRSKPQGGLASTLCCFKASGLPSQAAGRPASRLWHAQNLQVALECGGRGPGSPRHPAGEQSQSAVNQPPPHSGSYGHQLCAPARALGPVWGPRCSTSALCGQLVCSWTSQEPPCDRNIGRQPAPRYFSTRPRQLQGTRALNSSRPSTCQPGGQSLQRKLNPWLWSSSCTEAGLGLADTPAPRE